MLNIDIQSSLMPFLSALILVLSLTMNTFNKKVGSITGIMLSGLLILFAVFLFFFKKEELSKRARIYNILTVLASSVVISILWEYL
ncbi:MAG: hypothetical protein JXA60_07495 [Candidatus Coatesbacteria bacterium]|nr:hypothetical protein [Candidatus Coatesbacteria bacterium]